MKTIGEEWFETGFGKKLLSIDEFGIWFVMGAFYFTVWFCINAITDKDGNE